MSEGWRKAQVSPTIVTCNHRPDEGTSAQETNTIFTRSRDERGRPQRRQQFYGCRRAQDAEAQELLRGLDSSKTASAKRARHQNAVRSKPVGRSDLRKSETGPDLRSSGLGRVSLITEGTQLGKLLSLLSAHMEELNKKSIEDKCRMVKHCRVDKNFRPTQYTVIFVVETALRKPFKSACAACLSLTSTVLLVVTRCTTACASSIVISTMEQPPACPLAWTG